MPRLSRFCSTARRSRSARRKRKIARYIPEERFQGSVTSLTNWLLRGASLPRSCSDQRFSATVHATLAASFVKKNTRSSSRGAHLARGIERSAETPPFYAADERALCYGPFLRRATILYWRRCSWKIAGAGFNVRQIYPEIGGVVSCGSLESSNARPDNVFVALSFSVGKNQRSLCPIANPSEKLLTRFFNNSYSTSSTRPANVARHLRLNDNS